MSESRNGESRSYSSYTPSYSSYGGESRGGESRYSYFSAQRNEFERTRKRIRKNRR